MDLLSFAPLHTRGDLERLLGVIPTGVADGLSFVIMARSGARVVTFAMYLLPIMAVFWGALLHEAIRAMT